MFVEYLMKMVLLDLLKVILRSLYRYHPVCSDVCFPKLDARLGRTKIIDELKTN
jgi:hypothetical protein